MINLEEAIDQRLIVQSVHSKSLWQQIINDRHIPVSPRFIEKLVGETMSVTAIHNVNLRKLQGALKYQGKLNGISCSLVLKKLEIEDPLLRNIPTVLGNTDIWVIVKGLYNFSANDDIFSNVSSSGYRTLNIDHFINYLEDVQRLRLRQKIEKMVEKILDKFIDAIEKNIEPISEYSKKRFKAKIEYIRKLDYHDKIFELGQQTEYTKLLNPDIYDFIPTDLIPVMQEKKKLLAELLDGYEDILTRAMKDHFNNEKERIQKTMSSWSIDNDYYDEIVVSRYKIIAIVTGERSSEAVSKIAKENGIIHVTVNTVSEFEKTIRKYLQWFKY